MSLVLESSRTIAEVAKSIGVHEMTLERVAKNDSAAASTDPDDAFPVAFPGHPTMSFDSLHGQPELTVTNGSPTRATAVPQPIAWPAVSREMATGPAGCGVGCGERRCRAGARSPQARRAR